MKRIALGLAIAAAAVAAPAAIGSPTVQMAIVHFVRGCHVWGTSDSQPLGPSRTMTVVRGTRVQIRINCPMAFDFTQLAGPQLDLGNPRSLPGTVRTIVFAKAGLYRLQAVNVQSSVEAGLQTLGADNTLRLTVRVR